MTHDANNNGGLIQITKREDACPGKRGQLDLAAVRAQLDKATGPEYWRSLEELAGSTEFQQALHREFPKGASEWLDTVSRRGFLKVMGASLGLAGLTATTGCVRLPLEPIVP
jgi:molybdopterin-containing oxidoreductase family iron-sulfur binding subunit